MFHFFIDFWPANWYVGISLLFIGFDSLYRDDYLIRMAQHNTVPYVKETHEKQNILQWFMLEKTNDNKSFPLI